MATKNTNLGGTDWVDGEVLYADDLNDTFDVVSPSALLLNQGSSTFIYTGSDLDVVSTGTTSANKTFQISSAELKEADYLLILITMKYLASGGVEGSGTTTLKIERNETGQSSWSDVLGSSDICAVSGGEYQDGNNDSQLATQIFFVTLTAGEKSNGVDIKLTTGATETGAGDASITNKQIVFKASN